MSMGAFRMRTRRVKFGRRYSPMQLINLRSGVRLKLLTTLLSDKTATATFQLEYYIAPATLFAFLNFFWIIWRRDGLSWMKLWNKI